MIGEDLLDILRCPENRTRLRLAEAELLTRVNTAVAERKIHNRVGTLVEQSLDGGLVREDNQVLYPIIDGLPVLLIDEAIPLDQLD